MQNLTKHRRRASHPRGPTTGREVDKSASPPVNHSTLRRSNQQLGDDDWASIVPIVETLRSTYYRMLHFSRDSIQFNRLQRTNNAAS